MSQLRAAWVGLTVAVLLVARAPHAEAIPPFYKEFQAKYVKAESAEEKDKAFAALVNQTAKCNVCHEGTSKKMHNAYGKAVKKYLTKADFDAIKTDPDKSKKYIIEGLEKSEAEKSASGKSYGELIKAGKAPWEG